MMAELDGWVDGMMLKLSPAERRAVNRRVMYELRRSQAQRIADQKNPDGTPYEPRSKRLRSRSGRIRRKAMFAKLRTQRHLKVRADDSALEVGFRGRDAGIASVHQTGGSYRQNGQTHKMPRRRLLGFANGDLDAIADAYLDHLADW